MYCRRWDFCHNPNTLEVNGILFVPLKGLKKQYDFPQLYSSTMCLTEKSRHPYEQFIDNFSKHISLKVDLRKQFIIFIL